MRLTEDALRKAKRPTTGQLILWDDLLLGFGARLTPTRTAYVVQWRCGERRTREGLRQFWPAMSIGEARELARKRLGEVTGTKDAAGAEPLQLAMRRWFERQTEIATWRARYRSKVDGLIRHYIEGEASARIKLSPALAAAVLEIGAKPVASVTRKDVVRLADGMKARGSAEQLLAILSSFFNSEFERGVEIVNPAKNRLRLFGGRRRRTRTLTDAEFVTLWRALAKEGDPAHGCFAVLAYTGSRRREATQMRWSEIDLEAATWTLPPERRKTGKLDSEPFVIHLHPVVIGVIRRQARLVGNPHVFWGRRDQCAFDFHYALMQRLKALGLPEWRLHDLRRYLRSGLARLGVSQVVAEMCLGHIAKSGLVAVYDQHSYASEQRAAWQRWGDHLTQLIGPRAQVVKLVV